MDEPVLFESGFRFRLHPDTILILALLETIAAVIFGYAYSKHALEPPLLIVILAIGGAPLLFMLLAVLLGASLHKRCVLQLLPDRIRFCNPDHPEDQAEYLLTNVQKIEVTGKYGLRIVHVNGMFPVNSLCLKAADFADAAMKQIQAVHWAQKKAEIQQEDSAEAAANAVNAAQHLLNLGMITSQQYADVLSPPEPEPVPVQFADINAQNAADYLKRQEQLEQQLGMTQSEE